MEKKTVNIEGALHLFSGKVHFVTESDLACTLYDHGIELYFYCGPQYGSDKVTECDFFEFLDKYKNSVVRVEGGMFIHFVELNEKGEPR